MSPTHDHKFWSFSHNAAEAGDLDQATPLDLAEVGNKSEPPEKSKVLKKDNCVSTHAV